MTNCTLRILTRDEIRKRKPPGYLIPRIIPKGGLVSLVAQPSSKKTFVAVDIACCIATGTSFHGKPVQQGNVVYILAEGQSAMDKRLCGWETQTGFHVDPKTLGFIMEPLHLNLSNAVDSLVAALEVYVAKLGQVDLIIIDTLNRSLDGDENSPKDMSNFIKGVTRIISKFNVAVLVLHHPAKTGTGGARGHSAFNGAVDLGLEIKNGDKMKFKLHCDAKPPKDDEPAPPIILESIVVDLSDRFGFDDEGKPVTSLALHKSSEEPPAHSLKAVRKKDIDYATELIILILANSCLSRSELIEAAFAHGFTGTHRTLDRALKAKLEDGTLAQPFHGSYELSELQFDMAD